MRNQTFKKIGLLGLISFFVFLYVPYHLDAQFDEGETLSSKEERINVELDEGKLLTEESLTTDQEKEKQTPQYVPGEVLVKFKEGVEPHEVLKQLNLEAKAIERVHSIEPVIAKFKKDYKLEKDSEGWYWFLGKKYKEVFQIPDEQVFEEAYKQMAPLEKGLYRSYKIKLPEGVTVEEAVAELGKDPDVEYAEPNYIARAFYVPSDPLYSQQWAHQNTQAASGWDIQRGNPSIVIAVVDTGVDYTHNDLAANIWHDAYGYPGKDLVDIDTVAYTNKGYKLISGEDYTVVDYAPSDYNGHGTHCAGIVGAVEGNGVGVVGVCHKCKIMPVRTGFSINHPKYGEMGLFENDDIVAAIRYAVVNGAKIISMSFGFYPQSSIMKDAIDYAYNQGVVLVAAAGNENSNIPPYPAGYENVIAVAATNENDYKVCFSNFGSWIDVAAPGVSILSTTPNNSYASLSGTSMAAPYVAGLAGLILSKNPGLTNEKVTQIIRTGIDPTLSSNYYIGTGRSSVFKSIQINNIPIAKLDPGLDDAVVNGVINISGTATADNFSNYKVMIGKGYKPSSWVEVKSSNVPVSCPSERNSTILLCQGSARIVREFDRYKNIVWASSTSLSYPIDVKRLPNGNTLITDRGGINGNNGKVIEVNKSGSIVWDTTKFGIYLNTPLSAAAMSDGSILVAETAKFRVIKINKGNGKISGVETGNKYFMPIYAIETSKGETCSLWFGTIPSTGSTKWGLQLSIKKQGGKGVLRVLGEDPNVLWDYKSVVKETPANTLLYIVNNKLTEKDANWNTVWQFTGEARMLDVERLKNGNTIILYTNKIAELSPGNNVVWEQYLAGNSIDFLPFQTNGNDCLLVSNFDTSVYDYGAYTLKLDVYDNQGQLSTDKAAITINNGMGLRYAGEINVGGTTTRLDIRRPIELVTDSTYFYSGDQYDSMQIYKDKLDGTPVKTAKVDFDVLYDLELAPNYLYLADGNNRRVIKLSKELNKLGEFSAISYPYPFYIASDNSYLYFSDYSANRNRLYKTDFNLNLIKTYDDVLGMDPKETLVKYFDGEFFYFEQREWSKPPSKFIITDHNFNKIGEIPIGSCSYYDIYADKNFIYLFSGDNIVKYDRQFNYVETFSYGLEFQAQPSITSDEKYLYVTTGENKIVKLIEDNTPPVFSCTNAVINEDEAPMDVLDLHSCTSDKEQSDAELTFRLVSDSGNPHIDAEISGNRYLRITSLTKDYCDGYEEYTIEVTDNVKDNNGQKTSVEGVVKVSVTCQPELEGTILISQTSAKKVIEIDGEGNIKWQYATGLTAPIDADRLPNGNTLITDRGGINKNNGKVIEVDKSGNVVWSTQKFGISLNTPYDADIASDGNVLVAETAKYRVIKINKVSGAVSVITNLSNYLPFSVVETTNAGIYSFWYNSGQLYLIGGDYTRNVGNDSNLIWSYKSVVEKTPSNTLLYIVNNKLTEKDANWNTVWQFTGEARMLDVKRLENGNTMVLYTNKIVVVDSSGKVVWQRNIAGNSLDGL